MRVGSGEEIPLFPSDADYSSFIQREEAPQITLLFENFAF